MTFDQNLIFSVVGIANGIEDLIGVVLKANSGETTKVGILETYTIDFKIGIYIDKNAYIKIIVPENALFEIPTPPECITYKGFTFECEKSTTSNYEIIAKIPEA